MTSNQNARTRRSGCGCLVAVFGGLLILFGSLFVMTLIAGVVSNDSDVTDQVAVYLFIITVTVLPGFYLIRRARRRPTTTKPQQVEGREQTRFDTTKPHGRPPKGWESGEPSKGGSPTPAGTTTRLRITRPSTMGGRPYTVWLDDQSLGRLQPGVTGEYEISPGLHWVIVKTRRHESNTMMIEPREGDQIRLACQPAGGDMIDDLGRTIEGILLERVDS